MAGKHSWKTNRQTLLAQLTATCDNGFGERHSGWLADIQQLTLETTTSSPIKLGDTFRTPTDDENPHLDEERLFSDESLTLWLLDFVLLMPGLETMSAGTYTTGNPIGRSFMKHIADWSEAARVDLIAEQKLTAETKYTQLVADIDEADGSSAKRTVKLNFIETFLNEVEKAKTQKDGVGYTSDPLVDFLVRSMDEIAKKEFGVAEGLASPEVQVLDPFTGTGNFLQRGWEIELLDDEVVGWEFNLTPWYVAYADWRARSSRKFDD